MNDWFLRGGIIMWPLLALAIGVIALSVRAAVDLRKIGSRDGASSGRPPTLTPILFWGAVALLIGTLGTVVGIVIVAEHASAAGGGGAGLVWGGVGVALITLTFGILIFLLSGFLWLALDRWKRRLAEGSIRTVLACLLLPLAGLLAGCGESDDGTFVVTDSAEVRLASNLSPDRPYPATPVRLTSLQPPDSALMAMPWGVVVDPASGRIFVADGAGARVVAFESDGAYAFTVGRQGEGPGEFRSPTAIALDEPSTVAVWDTSRGVISRWSADGEFVGEHQAPLNYWGPGFASRGDHLLAVTQTTSENRRRQSLVEWTGEGEPRELFAVAGELVQMELAGMNVPAPRIFAPDLIWTTAGDTVLVLNGPEYRIDAHAEGRPVASIRRDIPPIVVTAELAAVRVQAGPYTGFMRSTGTTAGQIVAAVGYEKLASPIEWLATNPSGDLWVSRGSGRPVPDQVDVFAPDGRYVGTFDAPGFPVAFLSESRFVALEITSMGEPVLGLYRLEDGGDEM
jgi:sugar lactone lactonase YvrE